MKVLESLFLNVSEDIPRMIKLANNKKEPVVMEFNKIIVVAYPGEDFNIVKQRYLDDFYR